MKIKKYENFDIDPFDEENWSEKEGFEKIDDKIAISMDEDNKIVNLKFNEIIEDVYHYFNHQLNEEDIIFDGDIIKFRIIGEHLEPHTLIDFRNDYLHGSEFVEQFEFRWNGLVIISLDNDYKYEI